MLRARREEHETAARTAVAGSKRQAKRFEDLLTRAQHFNVVREEQMREFTRAWPALRRALARLGGWMVEHGSLRDPDDILYLRRTELDDAFDGRSTAELTSITDARRAAVREAARLVPPPYAGDLPVLFRRILAMTTADLGVRGSVAGLTGIPVSPGTATARARVILDASDFGSLEPGEVLVAPMTAPAWTPLFAHASAVVTDGGNAFSHASVVAREYGIPAVVGCVDATRRLTSGQRVTVDGSRGTVTLP
jgi:pyruvate,water dikinase